MPREKGLQASWERPPGPGLQGRCFVLSLGRERREKKEEEVKTRLEDSVHRRVGYPRM